MPESEPKTQDINMEQFVEPIGPVTEIDVSHRRSLLSKLSGYIALGLATLTASATPAIAKEKGIPVPVSVVEECPERLPEAPMSAAPICSPVNISKKCATPDAVDQLTDHFQFRTQSVRRAWSIVRATAENGNSSHAQEYKASIGFSADRDTIYKDTGIPNATQLAGRALLGAEWQRFVVYPYRFRDKHFRRQGYDLAIDRALSCGYKVMLTLAMNKNEEEQNRPWRPTDARRYFRDVAEYYDKRVSSYVILNEPNYPGWLKPIKGKSLAETAATLQHIGYRAIKRVNSETEVGAVDLSGLHNSMTFLKKMATWFKRNNKEFKADFIGYHPYQWFKKWNNQLPTLRNTNTTEYSKVIAIDAMHIVKRVVHRLYGEGLLKTAEGDEPPIAITEFAAASRGEGRWKERIIPDDFRARWYSKILGEVCSGKAWIKLCIFYGFNNTLLPKGSDWSFDTSLVNKWGNLDVSLLAIRQHVLSRDRTYGEFDDPAFLGQVTESSKPK